MIRNIRVIQKKRKRNDYVADPSGRFIFKEWTELVSWKLQKAVDTSEGIVWQDIDIIDEWVEDDD